MAKASLGGLGGMFRRVAGKARPEPPPAQNDPPATAAWQPLFPPPPLLAPEPPDRPEDLAVQLAGISVDVPPNIERMVPPTVHLPLTPAAPVEPAAPVTPEAVRLVIWDLDDTFWKGTLTEGGITEYVQAHHDIIVALARRGILSSVCSKNDPATVLPLLREKGILDYLVFPSISWEPKGPRLARLVETAQLRAPTVMFIDDHPSNRAEAAAAVPGLQVEDETFIPNMLADPRLKGKQDDELTRLKQYKLLEQRKQDEQQATGGSEEFLRGCDIRVYIEYDVEQHIDRAVELINRTNQLNYTKKRLSEDVETARGQLREQMTAFDRSVGLVRVLDKYGDYGFVGFFMTGGMRQVIEPGTSNRHLVHYCFSCRTLGMLIEKWVYDYLDQPELTTVGEVLTDLSTAPRVDWVRQVETLDDLAAPLPQIAPEIVFYGGCEAQAIGVYLKSYTPSMRVIGNYVASELFSATSYAAKMLDTCDRSMSDIAEELAILGLPPHLETGDLFSGAQPGTVFITNFIMDAEGSDRLRHKRYDWTFRISPNGLRGRWDALFELSEQELVHTLEAHGTRYTAEQCQHFRNVSRHLRQNYERVKLTEANIVEETSSIIQRIPKSCKLVILIDHDQRRNAGALDTLPNVTRYRSIVEQLAGQFSYVSTACVSDAILDPADVLDGNHYKRAVYLRLARVICDAAAMAEPRADDPLGPRRIARLIADGKASFYQQRELEDFVTATYQVLLRRRPEPGLSDHVASEISSGRTTRGDYIRSVARSKEFASKWLPNDPADQRRPAGSLLDAQTLRVPTELATTALLPKRVLIVGSCLAEGWARRLAAMQSPCESDTFLAGTMLPDYPPCPIASYDFQLVHLGLRFLLPDSAFAKLAEDDLPGHEALFAHARTTLYAQLKASLKWNVDHGLLTFVLPFIVPQYNAVGRLLPRYTLANPVYFVERLNQELAEFVARHANAFFFDLNESQAFFGRRFVQEDCLAIFSHGGYLNNFDHDLDGNRLETALKATDLYEQRVDEGFAVAWRELVAMYRTVRQIDAVKMVVVDLDDTLWRGTIAELDIDDLPSTEGWPVALWEALLFLKRRGILLGIISKNEEARVVEFWDKITRGRLSLDDFAVRKINWRPKSENMAELLGQVNLLPNSVLYIDDNPAERAAMRSAFPDIRVLGGTPLTWRRILLWSSETQVPAITAESGARTEMVRAQVEREEQRQAMPHADFLASLNVTMAMFAIDSADHRRFARVLELINKTNQFNTTGQRWTREECVAAFARGVAFHAFEVADRYTDYGLVGVLIVDDAGIRQFVMSCRIMGLDAEIAAVVSIGAMLRSAGAGRIFAAMKETERNLPCRNVYARCGFEQVDGGWERSLEAWPDPPGHIRLTVSPAEPARMPQAAE